jgi:hypothetical protein
LSRSYCAAAVTALPSPAQPSIRHFTVRALLFSLRAACGAISYAFSWALCVVWHPAAAIAAASTRLNIVFAFMFVSSFSRRVRFLALRASLPALRSQFLLAVAAEAAVHVGAGVYEMAVAFRVAFGLLDGTN